MTIGFRTFVILFTIFALAVIAAIVLLFIRVLSIGSHDEWNFPTKNTTTEEVVNEYNKTTYDINESSVEMMNITKTIGSDCSYVCFYTACYGDVCRNESVGCDNPRAKYMAEACE